MALVILSNYVDAAGWRRVVIANDANPAQSLALKFPAGMTAAEMRAAAQVQIDAEIARVQAANARLALLAQITNSVGLYQQGRLSAAQQTALLTALCAEWKGA